MWGWPSSRWRWVCLFPWSFTGEVLADQSDATGGAAQRWDRQGPAALVLQQVSSDQGCSAQRYRAAWQGVRVGLSVGKRPICAYRVGDPTADTSGLILGSMHGDEPAGTRTVESILKGPRLAGLDLWVIPTMNPDGLVVRRRQNSRGVDLNRNFGHQWAPVWPRGAGSWQGPRPWSEPESRAMRRFLGYHQPDLLVSIHQPLYAVDGSYEKSRRLQRRLVRSTGIPLRELTCAARCSGTMTQWVDANLKTAAVTLEYGPYPTDEQVKVTYRDGILGAMGAYRPTTTKIKARVRRDGGNRILAVDVGPDLRGKRSYRVLLQRRLAGRWITVDATRTEGRNEIASFRITDRGRYRISVPGGQHRTTGANTARRTIIPR